MSFLDNFKKCTKDIDSAEEIAGLIIDETLTTEPTTEPTNEVVDTVSIPTGELDLQNCNNVKTYYSAVGVPYLYGEGDDKIDPIEMFKDMIDEWDNDGLYTVSGNKYPIGHYFDTYDETGCQFADQEEFLEYLDVPAGYGPFQVQTWEDSWLPEIDDNLKPVGLGRWNDNDICWEESFYPLSEFLDYYYSGTPESDFNYANLIYQKFYQPLGIRPYEDLQPYYENILNGVVGYVSTNEGCFDNITEEDFIELKTPNFTPYLQEFQGWGRTLNSNGETCEWDWKKIAIAGAGIYLVFKIL